MKLKKGKLSMSASEFLLLLLLSGCLIIFTVFSIVDCLPQATASTGDDSLMWVCVDGKTFDKMWAGFPDSVIGNVTIYNVNSSTILWNAPIPTNHNIHLTVPHATLLNITWTDWRGAMCETHKVMCENDHDCLTNFIPPPPKSTQTQTKLIAGKRLL